VLLVRFGSKHRLEQPPAICYLSNVADFSQCGDAPAHDNSLLLSVQNLADRDGAGGTGVNDALEQLKVQEYDVCVIAIGSDTLASILTAAYLTKIGVKEIWAKATSREHGEILEQVGVHHVVYPENDMGRRVAHQVKGSTDFIEVDETYVIIKTTANQHIIGTRLGDSEIRKRYGVTVMAVKRGKGNWVNADSDTIVAEHDEVLVAGPTKEAEQFGLLK
jgi:trk system potassium uptake protein TrkA